MKGQVSQRVQERHKVMVVSSHIPQTDSPQRKRDEVAPAAQPQEKIIRPTTRSTPPRTPPPITPITREIDDGCLGPPAEADIEDPNGAASKRHRPVSSPVGECSILTPPCPTSVHVSKDNALQRELMELMNKLMADFQRTATTIQSKMQDILQ